eukprot:7431846-Karenia_brevis.AAC.1
MSSCSDELREVISSSSDSDQPLVRHNSRSRVPWAARVRNIGGPPTPPQSVASPSTNPIHDVMIEVMNHETARSAADVAEVPGEIAGLEAGYAGVKPNDAHELDAAEIFHDADFETQLRNSTELSDIAKKRAKNQSKQKRSSIERDRDADYVVDHPGGVCSQQWY